MSTLKLELDQADPLGILVSTREVVENARHVQLDKKNLELIIGRLQERFAQGLFTQEKDYGSTGNLEDDIQLVFIENVVNFCFWPDKGQPKWQVEWQQGSITEGGWYGLKACFDRGLAEGVPILDSDYLSSVSLEDTKRFFRGINGTEIPLTEQRMNNLHEAGKVLGEKFGGKFMNIVKASQFDAIELVRLIIQHFPSFRDISPFEGKEVRFLKRAQICPSDLSYILKNTPHTLKNLEHLTAFADYKLPQVLRMFDILRYDDELAQRVDGMEQLPHDSREEIEIRAATIWAVELLRQHIETRSAGDIDNALWLISQDVQEDTKPYHRTRTIYY